MKMDLPHLAHISFYNSWLKPRNKTFFFFKISVVFIFCHLKDLLSLQRLHCRATTLCKKKNMMHFEGDFSTRKCIESLHTEEIRG